MNYSIEVLAVTKSFGAKTAVDNLNLGIPEGTVYGFIGPNGSGKTTTIRMILRIFHPDRGRIIVLGADQGPAADDRVGYLPEERGLYKKMKVRDVIEFFAHLKGMRNCRSQISGWLERLGLADTATKRVDALSKGMSQKVQFICAVIARPQLLVLDEPFSGLDPVNQQVMEEIIREMAGRGRTVLFSTHVMQHAERLCDRILLIAKGKMIFDGTISQAKETIPRRVKLETEDDVGPLRELPEVRSARMLETTNGHAGMRPAMPTFGSSAAAIQEANGTPNTSGRADEGVRAATEVPTLGLSGGTPQNAAAHWELELADHADPQAILQTCFARGIRLRSFNQSEPTLHEVFMRLVGPEAKEASFR
jgi:ABC-2 type transport system ATP-binding protein